MKYFVKYLNNFLILKINIRTIPWLQLQIPCPSRHQRPAGRPAPSLRGILNIELILFAVLNFIKLNTI